MLHSLPRKSASSARRGATIAATPAQPRERADLLSHNSTVYNTKFSVTCQAMGAHSATISGPGVGTLQPALVLDASPVEAEPTPSPAPPPPSASHVIRPFDLDRDLDDLNAICANVCKSIQRSDQHLEYNCTCGRAGPYPHVLLGPLQRALTSTPSPHNLSRCIMLPTHC